MGPPGFEPGAYSVLRQLLRHVRELSSATQDAITKLQFCVTARPRAQYRAV